MSLISNTPSRIKSDASLQFLFCDFFRAVPADKNVCQSSSATSLSVLITTNRLINACLLCAFQQYKCLAMQKVQDSKVIFISGLCVLVVTAEISFGLNVE